MRTNTMHRIGRPLLVAGALILGSVLWLSTGSMVRAADQAPLDEAWVDEARVIARELPPRLMARLSKEIAAGGPEAAVGTCRDIAPAMAKQASSDTGWAIRRVSLKNRNPRAVPDDWERAVLQDFDRRAAAGEDPATLELYAVVDVDGVPTRRYMRALPTQAMCLMCHGDPALFSPALRDRLAELYPDDRATGYRVGDIRGAITLKRQ